MENTAFIAIGSNIGDRWHCMREGIKQINAHNKINVVNVSSVYETDPVGYTDQDLFLNMVIQVNTALGPYELLDELLLIEEKLGRKREIKWGPRTLDLDILLYNQENIKSEKLIVPHPRMQERAFVMVPLLEIDSHIKLPGIVLDDCFPDKEGVRIWKRKNGEDVFALFGS
ncbi:MAG: 2-amino-4-hydroxy-6-hydroxymethyldihydropteridine diphosphokinase [Bacillota bacterium]